MFALSDLNFASPQEYMYVCIRSIHEQQARSVAALLVLLLLDISDYTTRCDRSVEPAHTTPSTSTQHDAHRTNTHRRSRTSVDELSGPNWLSSSSSVGLSPQAPPGSGECFRRTCLLFFCFTNTNTHTNEGRWLVLGASCLLCH